MVLEPDYTSSGCDSRRKFFYEISFVACFPRRVAQVWTGKEERAANTTSFD
jgi:hypothetical protein